MSKAERESVLSELTSRICSEMLQDVLMDVTLQSHQEIARSRSVCHICHTRCGSVHVPGPSNSSTHPSAHPSRPPTPLATGTSTPTNVKDGNIYLDCVHCNRPIASNRYAPHLSSCMGIGTRKGAARNATARSKMASEAGRADSPYLGSDNGYSSDSPKGKAKSKAKRADDAEFNPNGKRSGSPVVSASPSKKQKKAVPNGSPVARTKSELMSQGMSVNTHLAPSSSQTKLPSRLRETSSVASLAARSRSSSPDSGSSSSTPSSPELSSQSSPLISTSNGRKNSKVFNKPPSPPRLPPPSSIRVPETDYLIDVEAEETGSSTDTSDSS